MLKEWNRLQIQLNTGAIDRRTFLACAAALGITGALTRSALAQVPKRGGHVGFGLMSAQTSDSLDPTTWRAEFMYGAGLQLYDQLVYVNEQGRAMPALATSWETKPGAKDWIFKLRNDVTFHNGKTLTADDVVYSLNRHRLPTSKSIVKTFLSEITDIKATSKDEISITLSSGNVDMPYLLSIIQLVVGPEGSNFTDGIGTGAFMLESFEPGVRLRVKRNPRDYRSDRGYVESVETLAINNVQARISALLSGSVHVISNVDPSVAATIEANPEMQIFNVAGGGHAVFVMQSDSSPFDNADLRLAMKYAIDRENLLKAERGYAKLGNDHPVPSYDPLYAADIPQRNFDPEKAKFHYQKSGHSGPITLHVADVAMPRNAVEMSQLFQASAAKAGINLQVNRVPNDGFWDNVWMRRPLTAASWSGRATADIVLTTQFKSDSAQNESRWRRPKFDQLLLASRSEVDLAKRKQMYHDLQVMLHEEGGSVIPLFFNTIDAGSRKVKGFVPHPVARIGAYRAPERIWLDS